MVKEKALDLKYFQTNCNLGSSSLFRVSSGVLDQDLLQGIWYQTYAEILKGLATNISRFGQSEVLWRVYWCILQAHSSRLPCRPSCSIALTALFGVCQQKENTKLWFGVVCRENKNWRSEKSQPAGD